MICEWPGLSSLSGLLFGLVADHEASGLPVDGVWWTLVDFGRFWWRRTRTLSLSLSLLSTTYTWALACSKMIGFYNIKRVLEC